MGEKERRKQMAEEARKRKEVDPEILAEKQRMKALLEQREQEREKKLAEERERRRFLKKGAGKQAFAYLAHEGAVDRDVWDRPDDDAKRLGDCDEYHVASGV